MSEPDNTKPIDIEGIKASMIEAWELILHHFSALFKDLYEAVILSKRQKWLEKRRYYRQQGYRRVNKRLIKKWENRR